MKSFKDLASDLASDLKEKTLEKVKSAFLRIMLEPQNKG